MTYSVLILVRCDTDNIETIISHVFRHAFRHRIIILVHQLNRLSVVTALIGFAVNLVSQFVVIVSI